MTNQATLDAAESERWARSEKIFDRRLTVLSHHVKINPQWTVAEFGVGRWGFARFYAQKFKRTLGLDIVDYPARHPGVEFFVSNGTNTEIPDNAIDLMVSHSVLEHVHDLDAALSEINRVTRTGGYLHLTVSPLYFSGYGSHINGNGRRFDNWEHLDPSSDDYLTRNPIPSQANQGHDLNMLTSMFLAAVGNQPWRILNYDIGFECKPVPEYVDRSVASEHDLTVSSFEFIGEKLAKPVFEMNESQ